MNALILILGLVPVWNDMPNATIVQDSSITQLMEDHWEGRVHGEIETAGWRVQIYSSNNQLVAKQEAEALKERLADELKEPVYVNFILGGESVGNYKTNNCCKYSINRRRLNHGRIVSCCSYSKT